MSDSHDKYSLLQEIRGNRDLLRTLFSGLPDLVFLLDREGHYLDFLSPETHPTYIPANLFPGAHISEIIPEKPASIILHSIKLAMDSRSIQTCEYELFKLGKWESFEGRVLPLTDTELLIISRNISKRKKREQEIVRSRQLYHEIARNLPDSGILIFDHQHRFRLAEGPALIRQGFVPANMEGKSLSEVLPDGAEQLGVVYNQVLAGESIEMENRYNGRIFSTRMQPLKDEDGAIYAGMVVSRDVTENRQMTEAINAVANQIDVPSETQFFSELVKGLAGIFQVDHVLVGEYNPETEQIQAAAYWMEGKILPEHAYDKVNTPCEHVLRGAPYVCTHNVQQEFPLDEDLITFGLESYLGLPLFDSNGNTIGLISLLDRKPLEDIEYKLHIMGAFSARTGAELERMQTTRALQESLEELSRKNLEMEKYIASNVELERFAYVASHDLREPLRNISGFAQLLEKRYGERLDKTAHEYIQFIVKGVHTMNRFIKDLLNYSRITSSETKFKEIPTKSLLTKVSQNLGIALKDAQLKWESIPERIRVSEPKMLQVFENLLSNSLKFRDPDRTPVIRISGKENRTDYQFEIQDNGIGIEQAYFEKVFMPFRKLHGPDQYPGSGIGLAICKRLIEQHGGTIWLESSPGEGTTFYFTLKKNPPEKVSLPV